jgi:iron complex transport system ATP-binding protein
LTQLLNIKDLSLGYKSSGKIKTVLENLNLSANKGELIALVGANGTGKSTLLKGILSIIQPLKGTILISDENILKISIKEKAKKISYVSTEVINISNFKVRDLVALGRFPHTNWLGKLNEQDVEYIKKSLQMVGMSTFEESFVNEISDGERQKIMIARTLAQNTDIIILDEPTAFLDLQNKYQLVNTLYHLVKKEKKLIIFSTHDINIALKLCDKIWFVNNRNILSESPEDLILNNRFSKIFHSDELVFDKNSFDFDFIREKKESVNLINNSDSEICYNLTLKALERNGFFISKEGHYKINIFENQSNFSWEIDDRHIFNSISDMIVYIKNNVLTY